MGARAHVVVHGKQAGGCIAGAETSVANASVANASVANALLRCRWRDHQALIGQVSLLLLDEVTPLLSATAVALEQRCIAEFCNRRAPNALPLVPPLSNATRALTIADSLLERRPRRHARSCGLPRAAGVALFPHMMSHL